MLGLLGNVGGGAYNYGSFRGVGGFPYDSPISPHFFRMGLTLPSPQDLPLPIKSLGLSSSEQEEGKKKEGERNFTARGSHEATGRDKFSRSTGN